MSSLFLNGSHFERGEAILSHDEMGGDWSDEWDSEAEAISAIENFVNSNPSAYVGPGFHRVYLYSPEGDPQYVDVFAPPTPEQVAQGENMEDAEIDNVDLIDDIYQIQTVNGSTQMSNGQSLDWPTSWWILRKEYGKWSASELSENDTDRLKGLSETYSEALSELLSACLELS